MPTLDDDLLPVFAAQHWLATRDDVLRAGGSRSQIGHRLSIGRWETVDDGVYRLVGPPHEWHAKVLAPILAIGGASVASHFCAAALHGIPGFGQGVPELSIERGQGHRRPGLRLHTSTDLPRCTPVVVHGVPATDVSRTILDCARYVGDATVLRAIEASRRAKTTDWNRLISTLAHHARRGRPGIQRFRQVIVTNAHREEVADSDFELLVLALLLEHGLPEPVLHYRLVDGARFVAEIDLAYPGLRIAIELDGSHHLEADVRERDLPRQNDLMLLGWTVLRFTWTRLVERPGSIVAEVRAAIQLRTNPNANANANA